MSKRTKTTGRRDFIGDALHTEQDEFDDERYYGLYEARVTDNRDPDNQGRVKAQVFFFEEEGEPFESGWITRKTIFRGPTRLSRGRKFGDDWPLPEVGGIIYVQAVAGNKHNLVWDGMPGYQEGQYGAPDLDKDDHRDWSWRLDFQNGNSLGIDTEGNFEIVTTGHLVIKSQCGVKIEAVEEFSVTAPNAAIVAAALQLLSVVTDQVDYPRPDQQEKIRTMLKQALTIQPGYKDPGINKVEDLT
ncbi:MAG: hypothetical protein AB1631_15760 [Acidobacteriota bacterium]